jgi:hypothetical protein
LPTPTYTALANVTLGSAASSVTFSSIPATYRDLVLVHSTKHSFSGSITVRDDGIRFNSDSGSNYPSVIMKGNGSTASSDTLSATSIQLLYGMASASFQMGIVQIMDYSATDKHKAVLYRSGLGDDTNQGAYAQASRWANTAAITTLTIAPSGSFQLLANSTFALYGIVA